MLPQLLTVDEVAAALRIKRCSVYAAASRAKPEMRRLKSTKVGHALRFKLEWINEYLDRNTR
jgi:hypothetical protein